MPGPDWAGSVLAPPARNRGGLTECPVSGGQVLAEGTSQVRVQELEATVYAQNGLSCSRARRGSTPAPRSRQGIVRRGRASRPPQRLTSRVMSPLSAVGDKRTIAAPASFGPQTPRRHPVGVLLLVPQGRHPDDRFLHGSSPLIGKRKEALEIRVPLCTWYARLDSNQWPTESEFSGRQRKTRCGTRVSVGLHNYWRIFRKYPELLRCNGSGLFANSRQIVVR